VRSGLRDLESVLLDDQSGADHLDVDRHRSAIVVHRVPGRLVITRRATLILMSGQGFQPLGDIDTIERRFHVGGDRCVREHQVVADGVAHVLLLSSIRRLTSPACPGYGFCDNDAGVT
jgi:hypothetical protein